jgi:hypothetical protein
MKSVHPQDQDRLESPVPSTVIHPSQADELLQEQMRRQHNARARQRAARHTRAVRPPL